MDIKRMDIAEFRERGYLFEANRMFFHPLGLALEVIVNEETGEEELGGIWDFRDDPEGILFRPEVFDEETRDRVNKIREERAEKAGVRFERYGFVLQPVEK